MLILTALMHSGLCKVEACQRPTGAVRAWKPVLLLPGRVPSPSARPCWHQCSRLRGAAHGSHVAAEQTLSLPCLGSQSSEKSNPILFS